MNKRKRKQKTWEELKTLDCPKDGSPMQKDMTGELFGCACGFVVTKETVETLVNRDFKDE